MCSRVDAGRLMPSDAIRTHAEHPLAYHWRDAGLALHRDLNPDTNFERKS
jgi:hypothetical protein